ncbi:MAG: YceH family protein [Thiohalocapsa sp.]
MTDTDEANAPMFTAEEARVIGCLMEKQRTTPDQYPLTLNALVTACNQKTSRHPVMHMEVGRVGHTVNQLRDRGLIHASFSGRTERYDHKLAGTFMLDRRQQALLCVLMLRGPQTIGELRTNTARMADFDDLPALQSSLTELERHDPPLVKELPRQAGMREQRYAHLLCGEPQFEAPAARSSAQTPVAPVSPELEGRVEKLETAVAALRAEVEALKQRLE